jgi:hypothetical protein
LDGFGTDLPAIADPMADWLSSPLVSSVSDPIAWWTAMEVVGHPLAWMTLDFLSAPGLLQHVLWNILLNKIDSVLDWCQKSLFQRWSDCFENAAFPFRFISEIGNGPW